MQTVPVALRENNNYLSTSLENAGVLPGFKKDKSKEKRSTHSDEEIDIERELAIRTDLSDAFDTLLLDVRNFGSGSLGFIGSVLGGDDGQR